MKDVSRRSRPLSFSFYSLNVLFKNFINLLGRQWFAYISNQEKGCLGITFFFFPFQCFCQTTREPKQCNLIEGIESHFANTEQVEQIGHIQTVSWGRFTFAFIAENSTVVPRPFMHRRKKSHQPHIHILKTVSKNGNTLRT